VELAALGDAAVPEIEAAISSVADEGGKSRHFNGAGWLLFAYAKIKGPAALARLQILWSNPNLAFFRGDVESSISLALNLSSYVLSPSHPLDTPYCRPPQPRDTVDQIILAWEQGDYPEIEPCLGPRAISSVRSLLRDGGWAAVRREYWHHEGQGMFAVGYRFETAGPWSQPPENLQGGFDQNRAGGTISNVRLDTRFTTGGGAACGTMKLQFLSPGWRSYPRLLRLDVDDLGALLRVIDSCATAIGNR